VYGNIVLGGKLGGLQANTIEENLKDFQEVEKIKKVIMNGSCTPVKKSSFNHDPEHKNYDSILHTSLMSTTSLGFPHFPVLHFKVMILIVIVVYSNLLAIIPLEIWVSQADEYRYCIFCVVSSCGFLGPVGRCRRFLRNCGTYLPDYAAKKY
jgi:hypothetical protein